MQRQARQKNNNVTWGSDPQVCKRAGVFARATFLFFFVGISFAQASETSGTINSSYKYAWSNVAGYINFAPTNGGLTITDSAVTGYAWGANTGWIRFNATQSHVTNDGEGNLGGYAWDSGGGWISFSGVTINSSGRFGGTATGSTVNGANYSINFGCTNCDVRTDWRPASSRTTTTTTTTTTSSASASASVSSGGGGGGTTIINNSVTVENVLLGLKVTPSPSALPIGGGKVTYTYSVSNIGVAAINGVKISDTACSPVTYVSGDTNRDSSIYFNTKFAEEDGVWAYRNINEVWTFRCITNVSTTTKSVATATGYSSKFRAEASAQATVVVGGSKVSPLVSERTATAVISLPSALIKNIAEISVKQLQQFLNARGFVIARTGAGSLGNETDYFGPATKVALAKFQAAQGITPAVGFFGPITKAVIQKMIGNAESVVASEPQPQVVPASPASEPATGSSVPPIKTPVQAASVFTRNLYLGMDGPDVAALQNFLIENATGFAARHLSDVGVSGYFGVLTQNALKEYQAANGIMPLSGFFGGKTRELIQQKL